MYKSRKSCCHTTVLITQILPQAMKYITFYTFQSISYIKDVKHVFILIILFVFLKESVVAYKSIYITKIKEDSISNTKNFTWFQPNRHYV